MKRYIDRRMNASRPADTAAAIAWRYAARKAADQVAREIPSVITPENVQAILVWQAARLEQLIKEYTR